jgi:hypothetical protein
MSREKIFRIKLLIDYSLRTIIILTLLLPFFFATISTENPLVNQVSADTANITPNGDGTVTNWFSTGTSYYTEIDEGTTPSTTDYINIQFTDTSPAFIRMSTISNVSSVSQIQLYVYHNDGARGELFAQLFNDDETTTYTSETALTRTSTNAWHSITFSGLSLTQAQLDSLSVRFRADRSGGGAPNDVYIYSVYAVVTYTLAPAISISLSTDGTVSFGHQDVNTTVDTTATGLNDIETVSVVSGPADLDVRATTFTDGVNNWSFQSSSGADQIKFDFSKDGTNWTNILLANTLYTFDTNVAQGNTRNLYLRLITPTSTTSYDQYSTTITIVASAP